MKISYLLTSFVAWGCFFNSQALAATPSCATPPSCEELGYTMSTDQCAGFMLKCPFDQNKAFCASYKSGSGICDPGMMYDITTHECYNGFPAGSLSNLYYILERNGNEAIMLYLNQFGSNATINTAYSELKTMASQTIEANSREYFTSTELRTIWAKQPFVSGVASLYKKVGIAYSKVFVKDGYIDLKSDLGYSFTAKTWSSNSSNYTVNKNIFKVKINLAGASNGTITPVTYVVDMEYPLAGSSTSCIMNFDTCSEAKSTKSLSCSTEAAGLATSKEVRDAFVTQAALKEFLESKKLSGYDAIIFTEDGCIYLNESSRDVTTVLNTAELTGYKSSCGDKNVYAFCKYTQ